MIDLVLVSSTCYNSTIPKWHLFNKTHLKNVGSIRYNEPPHANSPDVASGTVARRLRIDVHDNANDDENDDDDDDDNDNA